MTVQQSFAWGADGHRIVNRLAGAALPADVPEFLRSQAGLNALEYYGPEPDRWRSSAEPESNAAGAPEHFIDMEYADLVGVLPRRRYDFIRALAAAQTAHPDVQLTPEKVGLQPYVTIEVWERLKSSMREYRTLLAAKQDTKPVECEITFLAGWLGHYVGDGSMPLHTTMQYNGWNGPNPNGYTTEHKVHSLFESEFVKTNVTAAEVAPLVAAKPVVLGDVFVEYVAYLRHSHTLVEKTYQTEKAGGFAGAGTPEGKTFTEERLAAGATELRDMIYTAWVRSADPVPAFHP
ncbi:MAG TPA: S1/P1 nuclease [Edaphobacter sp.]|nr:S1/P1 nuclease [Edaphobacter sp.]